MTYITYSTYRMKSIGVGPNHLFSATPVHRHLPVMELTALREFRKSYAEQFDVFECLSSGLVLGVAHGLRGKKCRKEKKEESVKEEEAGSFHLSVFAPTVGFCGNQ